MSEDWLPHEPPAPKLRKKLRARDKTIIWALSTAGVCGMIYMFVTSPDTHPHAPQTTVIGYSGDTLAMAVGGGIAAAFIFIWWQVGRLRQFGARLRPGADALADGNYERAAKLFGQLSLADRIRVNHRAVAAYLQGYALTRAGDSAAAVGVLLGAERTPKLDAAKLGARVAIELARAFAVGGDVEKASRWLESARTRIQDGDDQAYFDEARGLVLCRQGRVDEGLRHYEAVWRHLEASLSVVNMREAWLLRAFAIATTSTPRDSAAAQTWIAMLRTVPQGELDWLTARWPELATFVVTHDLSSTAPSRSATSTAALA